MKLAVIFLAVAAANALHLQDAGMEMSPFSVAVPMFAPKASPYDRCFVEVEKSTFHTMELIKHVIDKRYALIYSEALAIFSSVQKSIECFVHPTEGDFSIDPNCVIDHLQRAGCKLRHALKDIINKRCEEAKKKIRQAMDILKDIRNC